MTGPGTDALLVRIADLERQGMAWLEIERGADWLTPERFPVFIRQTQELGDIYGLPTLDGRSIKIARHHHGATTDPDHIDRTVTDAELDRGEEVRRFLQIEGEFRALLGGQT